MNNIEKNQCFLLHLYDEAAAQTIPSLIFSVTLTAAMIAMSQLSARAAMPLQMIGWRIPKMSIQRKR